MPELDKHNALGAEWICTNSLSVLNLGQYIAPKLSFKFHNALVVSGFADDNTCRDDGSYKAEGIFIIWPMGCQQVHWYLVFLLQTL